MLKVRKYTYTTRYLTKVSDSPTDKYMLQIHRHNLKINEKWDKSTTAKRDMLYLHV